jgi:cell cycle protein kinase DBF2
MAATTSESGVAAMRSPARPDKAILRNTRANALEPSSQSITTKFDALSLASPTKRVLKENAPNILLSPPHDDDVSMGMTEQAKKSLRSINALRGLTIDEIELTNKPNVKRLATVTQLCTLIPN